MLGTLWRSLVGIVLRSLHCDPFAFWPSSPWASGRKGQGDQGGRDVQLSLRQASASSSSLSPSTGGTVGCRWLSVFFSVPQLVDVTERGGHASVGVRDRPCPARLGRHDHVPRSVWGRGARRHVKERAEDKRVFASCDPSRHAQSSFLFCSFLFRHF